MLKSGKDWLVGIALLAGVAAVYQWSPALRTQLATRSSGWLGWTEAARQADPVGFIGHVEKKLQTEVTKLQQSRQSLAGDLDQLQRKQREITALCEQARSTAADFRAEYQSAHARGAFPVALHGAKYSEEEAIAQVSLLLAEIEGFEATLARLEKLGQEAEAKREELVVRENATNGYLAGLGTQRELVRARGLTQSGTELIGQVDELLTANQRVADQPVRSITELLAREDVRDERPSTKLTAARQYLAAATSQQPVYSRQQIEPTPFELRVTQTLPGTIEESNQAQDSPAQN